MNILIADASPSAADMAETLKRHRCHFICTACDTERALNSLDKFAPDLVFVDMDLPGNGLELLSEIHDRRRLVDTVSVLLCSGGHRTLEMAEDFALSFGVFDVLRKPLSIDQLDGIIREVTNLQIHRALVFN